MLRFTYTKKNGDVSDRNLVVFNKPSDTYFGIDVTDVEASTRKQLEGIMARHQSELDQFLADRELTRNYRTFLKEGISFD